MSEIRKDKVMSAKIEGDLVEEITDYCEKAGITPSTFIRECVKERFAKIKSVPADEWHKAEALMKRSECLFFKDGRCERHTYEKGQFPKSLRKIANDKGMKVQEWTKEWTEGIFPFLVNQRIEYEFLMPSAEFCRDCRLWRPKE